MDHIRNKTAIPYKIYYHTRESIIKMFKALQAVQFGDNRLDVLSTHSFKTITDMKSEDLTYLGTPLTLIHLEEDYAAFNILSDMFMEENRLKSKMFTSRLSPFDYFYRHARRLLVACRKNNGGKITPHGLRETLWRSVPECTSFKPLNMKYIIKKFDCKSVLDFSAGWGDRLLAAMACDVRYVGVDPNHNIHQGYEQMIAMFRPDDKEKYTMIQSTIQDAKLPDETFDLVMTSPPYFNLEEYQDEGKVMEDDEDEWFENFLAPAIVKCASRLNVGGHLVLVVNQKRHETYVGRMIRMTSKLEGFTYEGVIKYMNNTGKINPQPMWIWEKTAESETPLVADIYEEPVVSYNNVFDNDDLISFAPF
jgi:hypothetical protein